MDEHDDDRLRWYSGGWQVRVEQAILLLFGILLAAWAFDRTGGGAAGFAVAGLLLAIAVAAGWHARSGGD